MSIADDMKAQAKKYNEWYRSETSEVSKLAWMSMVARIRGTAAKGETSILVRDPNIPRAMWLKLEGEGFTLYLDEDDRGAWVCWGHKR